MSRSLTAGLLCVLLVVGIAVLQHFTLDKKSLFAPVTTTGSVGEPVVTDDFSLEVVDLEVGSALEATDILGDPIGPVEANGVWVLVRARITAAHTTMTNFPAELRMKDGTTYDVPGWFSDSLDRATLSPGLPQEGAFLFEAPLDRIDEPALVVTHAPDFNRYLGAQASVALDPVEPRPLDDPLVLLPPEVRTGKDNDASE
ncbi:hypothetical protein ACFYOC_22825 [Nocardiopsis alba]|uniref:hypothetical protein n=1 Tax=Nocardiopsis alba TaxID=53437 RepID=UPI0033C0D618